MQSHTFGAFIDFDQHSDVADPPAIRSKDHHGLPDLPTAFELNELNRAIHENQPAAGPRTPCPKAPSDIQTPKTPNELESSRVPTPDHEGDTFEVKQTWSNPPINRWRVLAVCLINFQNGLNDAAPGPLLPYLEKSYHVNYAIVSLIFVGNALGFISAAPITQAVQSRLGKANALVVAQSLVVIAYIILVCHPPFPLIVIAFFLLGLGIACNLAPNNIFCANLANYSTVLGCFHGSYGIGGTIGPLIATSLINHGNIWSNFYFLSLSISLLNLVLALITFKNYERDNPHPAHLVSTVSNPNPTPVSRHRLLLNSVRNRSTLLGALFIFAYQGAEVSISGWVISFLISYRRSSPAKVGYVTSGFWGGITIGRFALSRLTAVIGEKRSVFALVAGAAAFQLLVWLIPNVIGEAISVAVVGLLLGPIYPAATAVFSKLIPRSLQVNSMAFIMALGSSGGAVAPFMTGLTAQKAGTWVLHPICIVLFAMMVSCWAGLPRIIKRRE